MRVRCVIVLLVLAGSVEYVDVPFEPNDMWVRLTPDVEIRVKEAVSTGNSYHFEIDMRPENLTHGQDAHDTHGRDARATARSSAG